MEKVDGTGSSYGVQESFSFIIIIYSCIYLTPFYCCSIRNISISFLPFSHSVFACSMNDDEYEA